MKEKMKKAFAPVRSIYDKASAKTVALSTAAGIGVMTMASSAFAQTNPIDDVFGAVDISTLQGKVITLITGFIIISLGFVGWKYAKRIFGMA